MPLAVVPVAPCRSLSASRRPARPGRDPNIREAPGLELGAQPVHVGQDLATQLPSLRTFGRVGGEQVSELVLLPLGLLEMIFQRFGDRLGREGGEVGGYRVGLQKLAVGPDRGGKLGYHGGQPGAGLRLLDRGVLAVDPRAVGHRTSQHPHVRRGTLQRVHAVAQPDGRVTEPEPPGVQPDALLGLGQRVIHPLDLAAQRPGPVQPLRRAPRVGHLGQPVRHLAEQVGHLAAQVPDGLLGGLDPQRSEHQAGGQTRGGTDERLGDAAGGGRVRVDREDQHGADRHLQDLVAEAQHDAEPEGARDEQAEHPPAERDVGGHRDGGEHAGRDRRDPPDGAADRVEQGGLHHEQRGQRGEHGARRPAGQLQREQVREHRRDGQPGDVDRRRLGPAPDQRELLGLAPGDRHGGLADALDRYGTDGETFHELSYRVLWAAGFRDSSSPEQNPLLLTNARPAGLFPPLANTPLANTPLANTPLANTPLANTLLANSGRPAEIRA